LLFRFDPNSFWNSLISKKKSFGFQGFFPAKHPHLRRVAKSAEFRSLFKRRAFEKVGFSDKVEPDWARNFQ
jgi:hypothetical protein